MIMASRTFAQCGGSRHRELHKVFAEDQEIIKIGSRLGPEVHSKNALATHLQKRPSDITLLGPKVVQKMSQKQLRRVQMSFEFRCRNLQNIGFRVGSIANSVFREMTEFMLFYASAKLERKCPRGRLLEKYANHTQIAGDISLGISLGASRVAPGLFVSGPNSSQERLGRTFGGQKTAHRLPKQFWDPARLLSRAPLGPAGPRNHPN